MDVHGLHASGHGLEHPAGDLLDILLRQGAEHDDVVDTVQELRAESLAQLRHHGLLGLSVCLVGVLLGLFVASVKAQLGARCGQRLGADVAGHDDDGVLEVHGAALRVGDAAVVQDLEHDVPHVLVGLFNLVE